MASALGVPVRVVAPAAGNNALSGRYGFGPGCAALIRPDGVVAWRCVNAPADPAVTLTTVLRSVLDR